MNVQPPMSARSNRASRTLSPGQIALVGTVHMDRESLPVLRDLFVTLSPSTIATEMSAFGWAFRRTIGRRLAERARRYLRKHRGGGAASSELAAMILLLRVPFEFLAARQAARQLRIPVVHLGRDRDSAAWLAPFCRDRWDDAAFERFASSPRAIEGERRTECRRALLGQRAGIRAGPRDRVYARRIGELAQRGESVAAVLGWEHVLHDVSRNAAWFLQGHCAQVWLAVDGEAHLLG